MNEHEWREYQMFLCQGMSAMTPGQLQAQGAMLANNYANAMAHRGLSLLQNQLIPPKVITDWVWNEDIW